MRGVQPTLQKLSVEASSSSQPSRSIEQGEVVSNDPPDFRHPGEDWCRNRASHSERAFTGLRAVQP